MSDSDQPDPIHEQVSAAGFEQTRAIQMYWTGLFRYINEFMLPYWIALEAFYRLEKEKILTTPPLETLKDYYELMQFNVQVAEKGLNSSLSIMNDYHRDLFFDIFSAWLNTLTRSPGDTIDIVSSRLTRLLENVVHHYPEAIYAVRDEYGFHFDRDDQYTLVDETDRFLLYQVLPTQSRVETRKNGKPVLIIPPYVLGPNILAFLPGEKKSYVHNFANMGIPTYVRIIKDIQSSVPVQTMNGENDASDLKRFCETIMKKHGRMVTLNGFCQGGFIALVGILSGRLDGIVDALITCVAPMDGTRSKSLVEYLEHLPPRFRDLGYAVKTLPNGNRIVDGSVMSWVYKLKSMEREAPVFTFHRDLMMLSRNDDRDVGISKTAAAINHWLIYYRTDLPEAITRMSFDSYTIPVDSDGKLPVKLFGSALNFKYIKEKKVSFLICYAEKDDLVDKAAALKPLDFIDAQVSVFPKGHAAIATSWSLPTSQCALHTTFGDGYRGPVRYQLDLESGAIP